MASGFRNIIDFFDKLGLFDVVLPFLLAFAIVFAIFEKTKVLGTDVIEGQVYTKKNLNAIVAFSIAFFVTNKRDISSFATEELLNATEEGILNESEIKDIGQKGKQYIKDNHDWEKIVEKTMEVYEEFLAHQKALGKLSDVKPETV